MAKPKSGKIYSSGIDLSAARWESHGHVTNMTTTHRRIVAALIAVILDLNQ
jgi:hypothetical protein